MKEGKTIDLFYDNDVYVFGRYFEEDKSLRHRENNYAVLGINFSDETKIINLGKMKFAELEKLEYIIEQKNQKVYSSKKEQVSKDEKGNLILEIPPKSIIVYAANINMIVEN